MREDLIKKVIKEKLFVKYRINESFDKPLNNIIKINTFHYRVDEHNIIGDFIFRVEFNYNNLNPYYFYNEKIDKYYDISWKFDDNMDSQFKNVNSWVKMTSTSFKIIDMFIREVNPLVIKFSNHTEGNWKIYNNDWFFDKLQTLFSEKFDILKDQEYQRIYLINKNVSKFKLGSIEKVVEQNCMTFDDAWQNKKFPKKQKQKGIVYNDIIKEQQKRILYKWKYLSN